MSRLFVIQFQSLYTSTSSVSIEANDFEGKEVQQSGRLTERKKRREGEGGRGWRTKSAAVQMNCSCWRPVVQHLITSSV